MGTGNKKIKIELTDTMENVTSNAGILAIAEFFEKSGLNKAIDEHIGARKGRGASDSEHILTMVVSQICGNSTVEQQKHLPGKVGALGLAIPSVTAARRYMECFVNNESELRRHKGACYVPEQNEHLAGFEKIHAHLFKVAHRLSPQETLTLDQDATYIESGKGGSFYNYGGLRGYGALNTYCVEHDLMVATQYRDANVNPGYNQLEELKRVLALVPDGVKKICLRSDSAGYQTDILRFCAEGKVERFGVIDFAISCPVKPEFRVAVMRVQENEWRPLRDETGTIRQEWAEVAYAPESLSTSKKPHEYRFFVTRERMIVKRSSETNENTQRALFPELEITYLEEQNPNMKKLHLTALSGRIYKIFGVVSNISDKSGAEIIRWHRGRCGKSEEAHDILKSDLGGGHVPSSQFGANAFWWNVSVLSMSVNNLLKRFLLPHGFATCRLKTLRTLFYTVVGKIVHHARQTVLKLSSRDIGATLLLYAQKKMERLVACRT